MWKWRKRGLPIWIDRALLMAILLLGETPALAAEPQDGAPDHAAPHWGYGSEDGPAQWGALSPDWSLCASGQLQSPVELGGAMPAGAVTLSFGYKPASLRIAHHEHAVDVLDNGHTIQVSYDEGSTLEIDGSSFELVQYHFHAPSEHTVRGRHFPMEMHLVHRSSRGNLAVVGVLTESGAHNDAFDPVWKNLPAEPGERAHLEHVQVDVDDLLPRDRRTYRYPGSLTTPPCTEGVRWLVFAEPIQLSGAQIDAFRAIVRDNNRPIQPLKGRDVLIESTPVR